MDGTKSASPQDTPEHNARSQAAQQSPRASISRLDGVDVLRGLSILAVILLHIRIRMHFAGTEIGSSLPRWLASLLFNKGSNGVSVFFAISGFLITLTSVRRFGSLDQLRPGVFYRIRFARIAPSLLLLLAMLSALHLSGISQFHIRPAVATLPRALLAALTFHLNRLEAAHGYLPASWDVLWSLSIEEMFHLFSPLLCALSLRLRWGMPLVIVTLLGFVAMAPFAKTVWTTNEIWQEKSYLGGMGGIALGCLAALLTHRLTRHGEMWLRKRAKRFLWVELCGALLMLFVAEWRWPHWHPVRQLLGRSTTDDTLLALGTCLVMVATALRGERGSWLTAPIRWFGRHSYEVYLTHEFVVIGGTTLYVYLHGRGSLFLWIVTICCSQPSSARPGAAFSRSRESLPAWDASTQRRAGPSPRQPTRIDDRLAETQRYARISQDIANYEHKTPDRNRRRNRRGCQQRRAARPRR